MAPESENNLRLEIGHVLFIDIVGYSKLLIEEQKERLRQLTDIVLATAQVRESTNEQLVRLPSGDGMALVLVADDLAQYRQWAPRLHDLGECEVKHGVRLHLVNLYAEELGNPAVPEKFKKRRKSKPHPAGGAPQDCFPQAEAAAKKALSLDDDLADALTALASVKADYNYDFAGALSDYERAIQLHPNDATAHHWLGADTLAELGQTEREITEIKRALALDPLSLIINASLGFAYAHAGRLDEAIAQLRKTVEMDSSFYYGRQILGQALELKGRVPEAMAEYEKAIALKDDPLPKAFLGHLYGTMGRREDAMKILEQLKETRRHRYIEAYSLAVIYLGLGDLDQALSWLEQGFQERSNWLGYIRVDPLLAPLHGDPRSEALAEKIVPAREFAKAATPAK